MFAMLMGSMFLLPGVHAGAARLRRDAVGHHAHAAHARDDGRHADHRTHLQPRAARHHRRRSARSSSRSAPTSSVTSRCSSSSTDIVVPLLITGVGFACLFIPLTTAALTFIPRAQLADAAGLNSFVRQIGGSFGLTIFATLLSNYAKRATASVSWHVTNLRPGRRGARRRDGGQPPGARDERARREADRAPRAGGGRRAAGRRARVREDLPLAGRHVPRGPSSSLLPSRRQGSRRPSTSK